MQPRMRMAAQRVINRPSATVLGVIAEPTRFFWWHVKLQRHVDRIYFLYEPPSAGAPLPEHGRIVVGLFKDHLSTALFRLDDLQ